jgi:hypothetical protein
MPVYVANVGRCLPAQPIDAILFEPHQGVVAQVLTHLRPPVIRTGVAPWRLRAPIVVEIDPAFVVPTPAIELPQIQVTGAQVIAQLQHAR